MNDSDPRPMPTQVLAAYKDRLNLKELLESEVFTEGEASDVRDELLDRLVKKYGNVEIEGTDVFGKPNLVSIQFLKRIAQRKINTWDSISIMISVEEYGGPDAVLPELAAVMQPYWSRWWESMRWEDQADVRRCLFVASNVMGNRQFIWLSAQYARIVVDAVLYDYKDYAFSAIEAAENFSAFPSEKNQEQARRAANGAWLPSGYRASESALNAASSAADGARASYAATYTESAAASSAEASVGFEGYSSAAAYSRLCALTKRLITPTLITNASRGLR